jgi:hypothetical protein
MGVSNITLHPIKALSCYIMMIMEEDHGACTSQKLRRKGDWTSGTALLLARSILLQDHRWSMGAQQHIMKSP